MDIKKTNFVPVKTAENKRSGEPTIILFPNSIKINVSAQRLIGTDYIELYTDLSTNCLYIQAVKDKTENAIRNKTIQSKSIAEQVAEGIGCKNIHSGMTATLEKVDNETFKAQFVRARDFAV